MTNYVKKQREQQMTEEYKWRKTSKKGGHWKKEDNKRSKTTNEATNEGRQQMKKDIKQSKSGKMGDN